MLNQFYLLPKFSLTTSAHLDFSSLWYRPYYSKHLCALLHENVLHYISVKNAYVWQYRILATLCWFPGSNKRLKPYLVFLVGLYPLWSYAQNGSLFLELICKSGLLERVPVENVVTGQRLKMIP